MPTEKQLKYWESIKGKIPWNKGKKGIQVAWNKGKKFPNISGENYWNWKGGKNSDGRYFRISFPNHPFANKKGTIYEHRLVVEKCLDRYLTPKEIIHHINGIKNDNRPENLYLFPDKNKHTGFHQYKIKPILISNI